MEKQEGKKNRLRQVLLSILPPALIIVAILLVGVSRQEPLAKYVRSYENKLHALETEAKTELDSLTRFFQDKDAFRIFSEREKKYENLYAAKGIVYLVYENDSLIFWSDHSPAVENYRKEVCLDNELAKLRNGWYEVIRHPSNLTSQRHFLSLILLKNEFQYQNKYLTNVFPDWYKLPKNSELKEITGSNTGAGVKTLAGKPLFELQIDPHETPFTTTDLCLVLLYGSLFVLLIRFFLKQYFHADTIFSSNRLFLIFSGTLIGLRALMILNRFPAVLYKTPLFDASVFGNAESFWFGYLGDILINAVLLFYLSIVFQKRFSIRGNAKKNILQYAIPLAFLLFFSVQINTIIESLVQNSNLSFRISDLFSLNIFSYLGFIATGILFFSFFIFSDKLISELLSSRTDLKIPALLLAASLALMTALSLAGDKPDWIKLLWPFVTLVSAYVLNTRKHSYSFSYGLPFIICFSIVSTHLFMREEEKKETETRKVYAERLSSQQDDVAENLFVDISKKISQDAKLKATVFSPPVNSLDLEQRIRQVYLSGYWERFDILMSMVDSACVPLIKTVNPVHSNNSYFDQQIENNGRETICRDLFFVENQKGKTRYVARIKINPPAGINRKPALLYLELEPKLIPDVIGFPELLLDRSVKTNNQLSDYSYAIYNNRSLVTRTGKYAYNYTYTWPAEKENEFHRLQENNFDHLIYSSGDTKVILSKQQNTLRNSFTTNSYFFAFFSLMVMVFLFAREILARKKLMSTSLNARIQLLLVMVVLISLMAFGTGTFVFVKNQFESQNEETLNQRTKSVLVELQGKFGELEGFSENYKEYTSYVLTKLSNVFLTDITLYDLKGNMYASSQPRLFEEGIVSRKMNPRAFRNVVSTAISDLVLKENVGKLQYYSSYQPFYNKQRKLMAYLNLPYFAKQGEQEKEISLYITALINIYVILFAISTIGALVISNLVTKPLRILQQRFSKIKFGKENEPIEWKEKDEIGSLVNEYNKMIAELEESAEKLAKSERESAWREMAKQVAHEIKNPLTPMKLSIQHLQRTLSENKPEELKEKVTRLSAMLIEQIETLSNIASEFSAFAKMPKAVIDNIRISEMVSACAQLFKETENAEIIFKDETGGDVLIKADRDQCNRVFTNLIKNAVQSIPEGRLGRIEVSVALKKKQVVVAIKDNGTGISPDVMDKIFTPNFSTKTEGMGLGLAMVKNIVESFSGTIWFETTLNAGTTFYVSFPSA
jgi:two-component system, NtrC family, nitrogen regulation sensor histidine kinase NtrY